ncbi:MAG: hypothetical protein KAV45_12985, partial [Calditrichia bacterium]|nr:hypothetical protein [Calditrichia bacterium]
GEKFFYRQATDQIVPTFAYGGLPRILRCYTRITFHTLMLFYSNAKWLPGKRSFGIRLGNGYGKGQPVMAFNLVVRESVGKLNIFLVFAYYITYVIKK